MELITRTIYSNHLQSCLLTGKDYSILTNSTLNEKFGVQAGQLPDSGVYPKLKYMAIGCGGHKMSVGANSRTKVEVIQHRSTDAALYDHIPFVMRELTNDLTTEQKALYAMRKIITRNSKTYAAYYLRRLNMAAAQVAVELTTVSNGTATTSAFTPNSGNLSPSPQDLTPEGINLISGDYVSASVKLPFVFNTFDVEEIRNVATVLLDDPELAIVSEIGLVSGVDKTFNVQGPNSTTFAFSEAISAQVLAHVAVFQSYSFGSTGTDFNLDVGATEPLFKLN